MKFTFISATGLPTEFWITLGAVIAVVVIGGYLAARAMRRSRLH